jgi:hypothetical protein
MTGEVRAPPVLVGGTYEHLGADIIASVNGRKSFFAFHRATRPSGKPGGSVQKNTFSHDRQQRLKRAARMGMAI